jgi:hypothetical protein
MTTCFVHRLFCGERCSIRADNAHSCTCIPFFFCLPLCLPFSPCPFSLASLIRFPFLFLPNPHLFSFLSYCLLFLHSFFIHFFPFHTSFYVSLCRCERKKTSKIDKKKVKTTIKKELNTEYSVV